METQSLRLRPEPWRWTGPRVLVEHPDEAAGLAIASSLRLAGYAVAVCPGPREREQCPLTGPDGAAGCTVARDADLVVSCLGFERDAAREVLRALRTRCPDVPLVVELPGPGEDTEWEELLPGCRAVWAPATPGQVVTAAQDLLGAALEGDRRRG